MPFVVSGDAAKRLTRVQYTAEGQTSSSGSVTESFGKKEHYIGALDTQLLSSVSLVTIPPEDLRDGLHRTVNGVARATNEHVFIGRDPEAELIIHPDDLGGLGLYNGSLVQVRLVPATQCCAGAKLGRSCT